MKTKVFIHSLLTTAILCCLAMPSVAQFNNNNNGINVNNIGGVLINVDGVLKYVSVEKSKELQRIRQQAIEAVPGDLQKFTPLRFVSLKKLMAAIKDPNEIKDQHRALAGLQAIHYVMILPESNDIVIAGPAEGWKIDPLGNPVGITTGKPVLLLDDLIVALRTYRQQGGIATCSIDPTQEGLQNMQQLMKGIRTMGNPKTTMKRIEKALGQQTISIKGIEETSHFARVMVAADFRMKRIAMALDPSPVPGLPSYLSMVKTRSGQSSMPRWWLAPNYESLHTDKAKQTWELRGQGMKCMSEDEVLAENGTKKLAKKSKSSTQRWAALMTEKFPQLAEKDSTFGQLKNLMDLAVVASIIGHEKLEARAGLDLQPLAETSLEVKYLVPRHVDSQASVLKRGRNWIITASGGIEIIPQRVVAKATIVKDASTFTKVQENVAANQTENWWWE